MPALEIVGRRKSAQSVVLIAVTAHRVSYRLPVHTRYRSTIERYAAFGGLGIEQPLAEERRYHLSNMRVDVIAVTCGEQATALTPVCQQSSKLVIFVVRQCHFCASVKRVRNLEQPRLGIVTVAVCLGMTVAIGFCRLFPYLADTTIQRIVFFFCHSAPCDCRLCEVYAPLFIVTYQRRIVVLGVAYCLDAACLQASQSRGCRQRQIVVGP